MCVCVCEGGGSQYVKHWMGTGAVKMTSSLHESNMSSSALIVCAMKKKARKKVQQKHRNRNPLWKDMVLCWRLTTMRTS